jgi:hypothetical protein
VEFFLAGETVIGRGSLGVKNREIDPHIEGREITVPPDLWRICAILGFRGSNEDIRIVPDVIPG